MKQSRKSSLSPKPVGQVQEIDASPNWSRNMSGWRKRFRDSDDKPLPVDGIRIDVTTGEKLERIHESR